LKPRQQAETIAGVAKVNHQKAAARLNLAELGRVSAFASQLGCMFDSAYEKILRVSFLQQFCLVFSNDRNSVALLWGFALEIRR
jgi:hypothetical protein